jgi:hypothetical protein
MKQSCGGAIALLRSTAVARSMHFGRTGVLAAALVGGTLAGGCSSSSPVDQNLGTPLGADFVAPVTDAASDTTADTDSTDVPISSGAAGTTGTAGTTGSTGTAGTAGTAGTGGAAGQAGTAGSGGAGGAAGSGGAGTGS